MDILSQILKAANDVVASIEVTEIYN